MNTPTEQPQHAAPEGPATRSRWLRTASGICGALRAPGNRSRRLGRTPTAARAGLTVVELTIASGIVAVLMLASAAAMGEGMEASALSRQLSAGALFLETVEEDLASIETENLPAMNGQVVYSTDALAESPFRCEITVFQAATDLYQVELALVEQRTARTIATVHGMRADA